MDRASGSMYGAHSGEIPDERRSPAISYAVAAVLSIVAGFAFAWASKAGIKPVIAFFVGIFMLLVLSLFLNRLKSFLIFALIVSIPLQVTFHLIHDPLPIETTPFMAGVPVDMVDVILALLYGHWLSTVAWTKKAAPLRIGHPFGTLLLLWLGVSLLTSYFAAHAFRYSLYELVHLGKGFLLYLYLVNNTSTEKELRLIVFALFAGMSAHALYASFQYATGWNYTLHGETTKWIGPEGFRSIGFFGSPDAAAVLMTFVLPLAVAYYFVVREDSLRLWVLFGIISAIPGLLATKVRAAWLATFIAISTFVFVSYFRGRISSMGLIKTILAGIFVLALAGPFIYVRFKGGTYGEDRVPLVWTAINMIHDRWVLGVGLNNYFFNIEQYVPITFRHQWAYTVHNEYLLRVAEGGIFGFLLYYTLCLALIIKLWKITKSSSPLLYAVSLGLFSAMIGSIPHRVFSFYHYSNVYNQFMVVLAIAILAERLYRAGLARDSSSGSP